MWIRTIKFLLSRNSIFQYISWAVVENDFYFILLQFFKHCNPVTTLSLLLRKMFLDLFFSNTSEFYSEGETCYFDGIGIPYSWSRRNFQSENIFPEIATLWKTNSVIYFIQQHLNINIFKTQWQFSSTMGISNHFH